MATIRGGNFIALWDAINARLKKDGSDPMTGDLVIQKAIPRLRLDDTSGQNSQIQFDDNGTRRCLMYWQRGDGKMTQVVYDTDGGTQKGRLDILQNGSLLKTGGHKVAALELIASGNVTVGGNAFSELGSLSVGANEPLEMIAELSNSITRVGDQFLQTDDSFQPMVYLQKTYNDSGPTAVVLNHDAASRTVYYNLYRMRY